MESKVEKPFTLTVLGTLTEFTPNLKETPKAPPYIKGKEVKDYPKGELLSLVAFLIKTLNPAKTTKVSTKNPYPYQSDEVTVINGPKMDGADVGDKIAWGLAELLKAIARGQTLINIIAHSRGSVQSILIAHELQNIQTLMTTCANFDEVLKKLTEQQTQRQKGKPTNNTPDIIEPLKSQINLIPREEQDQWFNKLRTFIPDASINFFGIDPVPGDCFPITWYDERFFVLPVLIKNTELIYYANERTARGFTPICPEIVSKEKQNFVRYSMPGHHGTGSSGNNGSQQNIIVSANDYKTTHVQKLLIYKLINFLNKHHVQFNDGRQLFHQHTALGKKYLGVDSSATIDVATLDFATILRTLYAEISKNQKGYEAYNLTHYSYMGLASQRETLLKGHSYGLFNNIFATYPGYVNEEHASLMQAHFFKIFGLDTPRKNQAEMLANARLILEEHIGKILSKEPSILDSEVTRKTVLDTFGIVIHQVSQQYLTEDWYSDEKQKEKDVLYQEIINFVTRFKELAVSENIIVKQFVTELLLLGYSSINRTLVLRAQDLKEDFKYLQEPIDSRLAHFFNGLLIQISQDKKDPPVIMDDIINTEEYKILPNHPPETKITYIYKKLTGKGLEKYTIEQLTKSFEEQHANNLEDFIKLYRQIQTLIYDLAALRSIVPNEKIEVDEVYLSTNANELVLTAAERFYKDRPEALPPIAIKGSFMQLAEQHAIEHFGVIDRHKKTENTNPGTSGIFSFFWNPIINVIYGSPGATATSTVTPNPAVASSEGSPQQEGSTLHVT